LPLVIVSSLSGLRRCGRAAHPEVIAAVDVVAVSCYPCREGIALEHALAHIHALHQQVIAAAGDKMVFVSESGWPSCGDQIGAAVPSLANERAFALSFLSWARANEVPNFYFSTFDESWRAVYEGPQGACWGILDKDGNVKPGMQDIFAGVTVPDNWTPPGGPGAAAVIFTVVPPLGSFDDLSGQVLHVPPVHHRIAVYIRVGTRWWSKPSFTSPITPIRPDGSWTADITTGGGDHLANTIVAFLIHQSYSPPLLSGQETLPLELDQNALAKVSVTR
jgi:Glycosyl hydrolases family 17